MRRGAGRRGERAGYRAAGAGGSPSLDVCGLKAGPGSQLRLWDRAEAFTGPCVGGPVLGVRDDSWGHARSVLLLPCLRSAWLAVC